MRRFVSTAVVVGVSTLVLGVGTASSVVGGQSAPAESEAISYLAVVQTGGGTWNAATGRLVLTGVEDRVVWFADHPGRQTGSVSVSQFIGMFFDGESPPNAALEFESKGTKQDVAVVELSNPRYDQDRKRLTFSGRILDEPASELDTGTALADFVPRHDGRIASSFKATTLFVDPATLSSQPVTGIAQPGNDFYSGSFTFTGTLDENNARAQFDVDCTKQPIPDSAGGGYYNDYAHKPSDPKNSWFDQPRLDTDISGGASFGWVITRVSQIDPLSADVDAMRFVVALNQTQNPNQSYSITVWCVTQQDDAYVVYHTG